MVWPIHLRMALITTHEAAKRLKISQRRVRALIESGILHAQKMGRDWVIDEASVATVKATPRPRGRPKKKD